MGQLPLDQPSPMEALVQGLMVPKPEGSVAPPPVAAPIAEAPAPGPSPVTADPRPSQHTPLWMDVPAPAPHSRRGAQPRSGGGLTTLLFFGLIVLAVGAAGTFGVMVWGPEKAVTNRPRLASEPPAAEPLPSLADSATPPPAAAEPTESAPADPTPAATTPKKGKRAPKGKKALK